MAADAYTNDLTDPISNNSPVENEEILEEEAVSEFSRYIPIILVAGTILALLLSYLFLGSRKSVLYSNLEETETNMMMTLLNTHGVAIEKKTTGDDNWQLLVGKNEFSKAVSILTENGYPKEKLPDLGQMIEQKGLTPSSREEHMREIYYREQQLGQTLAYINGVVRARVHLSIPEEKLTGKKMTASPSASVAIYHLPNANLSDKIDEVRTIVSGAIHNLREDDVDVSLFPSGGETQISVLPSLGK